MSLPGNELPRISRAKFVLSTITLFTFLAAALFLALASSQPALILLAATPPKPHLFLPIALNAPTTAQASWGAPVVVSPADGSIWVVNPDAASISAVDAQRLTKIVEIAVGGEPWSLAFSPDGATLYVVDRAGGLLVVVDAQKQSVAATIAIGPEPSAVVVSPSGQRAYVSVTAANTIAVINTQTRAVVAQLPVAPLPAGLAVNNHHQLYVTHLLALPRPSSVEMTNDGRAGRITVINMSAAMMGDNMSAAMMGGDSISAANPLTQAITLLPDTHGFPNLLSAISLNDQWLWAPEVRDAPALPNGLTTTVFSAVSVINRGQGVEDSAARLSLNEQDTFGSPVNNPVAAIPSPDGKTLYVVLAGSNQVEIIDISDPHHPRLVKFLPAGKNPRGMALSADSHWGYVMSYLARSLTVLDLVQQRWLAEVPVTHETLDLTLLRGKILFNNATDLRLTRQSWISCASCHPDGGSDSVTWAFPDGPRQAPALWNSGKTLPWHWSAALDEPQDVEQTIQIIQQGVGLSPGVDPPLLGQPLKGRSTDLDALSLFLQQGIRPPHLPQPQGDAQAKLVERGRSLFVSAGCAACHGDPQWTISALPGAPGTLDPDGNAMVDAVLRDVGTYNPADLRGATGFDVPSLLGVGLTAPYLHDGSMATLDALLRSGHPHPASPAHFADDEIQALVAFLRTIDANTPPIAGAPK